MVFEVVETIRKKRAGQTLSEAELRSLLDGYLSGRVADYQMSAFLMAVCFRGMAPDEMQSWARLMWQSGVTLPRAPGSGFYIDKHSTGGVGDKTSLLLVPLVHCAAEKILGVGAVRLPMISGRGLDFTGGTLDKLDCVPGFSSQVPLDQACALLDSQGFFMCGQTQELAPADRLLYALRDVTATVDCVPLIVSSILSKKLAENLDGLVLDVKFGSGAFMKHLPEARTLAHALAGVASAEGVATTALLTRMDEPLGWKVGHQLEVEECADFLLGRGREPGLQEVTLELAGQMLSLASRAKLSPAAGREACETVLNSEGPLRVFKQMFQSQGGDWPAFEARRKALESRPRISWAAPATGHVSKVDALGAGQYVRSLGGGRRVKTDSIDADVGLVLHKKVGDSVQKGETILEIIGSQRCDVSATPPGELDWVQVQTQPVGRQPWVLEVIREG